MPVITLIVVLAATSLVTWALDALLQKLSRRGRVLHNRGPEVDANATRTRAASPQRIPDYVSAITAYRAWGWNGGKLKSFNGECWEPRTPMEARCKVFIPRRRHSRYRPALWHQTPHQNCSCGVYAAKTLDQLRQLGYANRGVYGEVHLWGTVVEHSSGWRAQYAYPKRLVVSSPDTLILSVPDRRNVKGVPEELLAPLTEYGADVYLEAEGQDFLLWSASGGYDEEGLKKLPEVRIVSEAEATAEEEQFAALMRHAIRQARSRDRSQDRWPGPPPSPPAIPVHSVADILRILRSRRPKVQVQWTMYAESTA